MLVGECTVGPRGGANYFILSLQIDYGKTDVQTLYGKPVEVYKKDDYITVNGANVVTANVLAYNGIIHVIDEVS